VLCSERHGAAPGTPPAPQAGYGPETPTQPHAGGPALPREGPWANPAPRAQAQGSGSREPLCRDTPLAPAPA